MKKKLLLGLAAISISAVAMAAAPIDFNATPTDLTTVFQGGQTGQIKVTGKVTSTIPPVLYTVFATNDNGVTDFQDTLALPDFIISVGTLGTGGFINEAPKIKVAKVNADKNGVAPLERELVTFKLNTGAPDYVGLDASGAGVGLLSNFKLSAGKKVSVAPTAFFAKEKLQEILNRTALPGITVGDDGAPMIGSSYMNMTSYVQFDSPTNGELVVTSVKNPVVGTQPMMNDADSKKVANEFSAGEVYNACSIDAIIEF